MCLRRSWLLLAPFVRQTFVPGCGFIGWRTDKRIPPSPADPNVSHCKKLKVTGLTWASFPRNNSFSPSFYPSFLSAREVLNVTVHPLPPATNSQQSFSPPAQHSHLLSLTYANAAVPFILLVALSQGEGEGRVH